MPPACHTGLLSGHHHIVFHHRFLNPFIVILSYFFIAILSYPSVILYFPQTPTHPRDSQKSRRNTPYRQKYIHCYKYNQDIFITFCKIKLKLDAVSYDTSISRIAQWSIRHLPRALAYPIHWMPLHLLRPCCGHPSTVGMANSNLLQTIIHAKCWRMHSMP